MIYHRKSYYSLHSVGLVGVSTAAELVLLAASPFNVVDELKIRYFTRAEVQELIRQYMTESGQAFEEAVIAAIYENTQGQPGLVCALCAYLTDEIALEKDHILETRAEEKFRFKQRIHEVQADETLYNIYDLLNEVPLQHAESSIDSVELTLISGQSSSRRDIRQ